VLEATGSVYNSSRQPAPEISVRLVSLAAFLIAAATLIRASQDPPAEPPRFRVGVDAVRMDVVVTDRHGNLVTDLTADDFEVRQDGKLQPVTLARYVTVDKTPKTANASRSIPASTVVPTVGGARLARSDVQRTIVLVVDDLGIAWENMEPTRRALRRFVAEHVQPNDLVALVKTSVNAGVGQQLTLDRRVLNAAIEQVRWNGFSRRGVESFTPLNASMPLSAGGPGPAGFRDPADLGRLDNLREAMSAAGTLGMLQMTLHGVRDLPGRKAVVLISEGFELFERDPDGTFQPSMLPRQRLDRVVDLAMRMGVVVYTLDPRGLVTFGLNAADNTALMTTADIAPAAIARRQLLLETQESLRFLAEQTGGRPILNNNDLVAGLKTISDDLRGYYVIGYEPPDDTFAAPGKTPRFHRVSVEVKRPGLRVRTRKGFLGVADPERAPTPDTPEQALREAAMSPLAVTDIPVRATLLPAYDRKGAASVRAMLYINQAALTFAPDGTGQRAAKVDVFGMVFDEWGAPTSGQTAQFTVLLDGDTDPATLDAGVVYTVVVPVPKPGGYQARFAVRDATSGALGATGEFVDLPDVRKGQLALSGVVLAEERPTAGTDAADSAAPVGVSSPALRVFTPGARLVFSYEIYNAAVPVEARVAVWRNGRPLFTAPPSTIAPPVKKQPTKVGGGIKLGETMPPGDYIFQVTATTRGPGRAKPKTTTRWTSFEIRAH
jgi:VWFA-related protein